MSPPYHSVNQENKADSSFRPRTTICDLVNDGNGIREGSSNEGNEGELQQPR